MGKSNRHDSAPPGDPGTWPAWTDDDRWELGPDRPESEQDDGRDVHLPVDDCLVWTPIMARAGEIKGFDTPPIRRTSTLTS